MVSCSNSRSSSTDCLKVGATRGTQSVARRPVRLAAEAKVLHLRLFQVGPEFQRLESSCLRGLIAEKTYDPKELGYTGKAAMTSRKSRRLRCWPVPKRPPARKQ